MTWERILEAKTRRIDEVLDGLTEREKSLVLTAYIKKSKGSNAEKILEKARATKGCTKAIGYITYGLLKALEVAEEDIAVKKS